MGHWYHVVDQKNDICRQERCGNTQVYAYLPLVTPYGVK